MKTIEVSEETYEQIKDQLLDSEDIDISELDDLIGKKFFFRTVTYHMTGKVIKRIGNFVQLEKAAWIADSGRFMTAIKTGELNEVEPVGSAFLNPSANSFAGSFNPIDNFAKSFESSFASSWDILREFIATSNNPAVVSDEIPSDSIPAVVWINSFCACGPSFEKLDI